MQRQIVALALIALCLRTCLCAAGVTHMLHVLTFASTSGECDAWQSTTLTYEPACSDHMIHGAEHLCDHSRTLQHCCQGHNPGSADRGRCAHQEAQHNADIVCRPGRLEACGLDGLRTTCCIENQAHTQYVFRSMMIRATMIMRMRDQLRPTSAHAWLRSRSHAATERGKGIVRWRLPCH